MILKLAAMVMTIGLGMTMSLRTEKDLVAMKKDSLVISKVT